MSNERLAMTQKGYDKLVETLEYLKTTRREEISTYMGKALEDGDLRESAAYDEARMQQSENEARILELEHQLERAYIKEDIDTGSVSVGAKLTILDHDNKERNLELVGTFEANALEGKISDISPVGAALMGHVVGDEVEIPSHPLYQNKSYKVTILNVQYD